MTKASPVAKGEGRALRRARTEVREFEKRMAGLTRGAMSDLENKAWDEGVLRKRYEKACALIAYDRLQKS